MKAKLITAGILCALAGVASAGEPVALSETQMDSVTAGGIADTLAVATATGRFAAATLTAVAADTRILVSIPVEVGYLNVIQSTSAASSNAIAN